MVQIGSNSYSSQVNRTNVGKTGKTGSTNSAGSADNTGSTQRGSATGSFDDFGSVGSASSLSTYKEQKDADIKALRALRAAVFATQEYKAYQKASSEFEKVYNKLDKQRPWGTAQDDLYNQYRDAKDKAKHDVMSTPAYKAFDVAEDSYIDKYGISDVAIILF